MATIRDVAEQAGVSIATVSRALNGDQSVAEKTRERVVEAATSLGYRSSQRSTVTNIALAFTQGVTLSHPFDAAVLDGACAALSDLGEYDIVVMNLAREKKATETYSNFFSRKGIGGVLLRTVLTPSRGACRMVAEEGFPHVVVSERFDTPGVNFVDGNSGPDSYKALRYLIQLGHREIAFGMHTILDRDQRDRFEAYKRCLADHDLPFREELVHRQQKTVSGGATLIELAMRATPRPTALFLADPLLAVGAMNRARDIGVRIPEDVSVIGFDDTDLRNSVFPTLTAVCRDSRALGYEAATSLVRSLAKDGQREVRRTIPTFFEINASTAPPGPART